MKNILLPVSLLLAASLHAQYYYNDIVTTGEITRLMKTYVTSKVRTVSATGYDANNVKSTDFLEFQEVKENGTLLKITSHTNISHNVSYQRFDAGGRLITIRDSSGIQQSEMQYTYDAAGRITQIQNNTRDSSNDFNQIETHYWFYNANGKPEKMLRVVTNTDQPAPDSLEVRFLADENGNTGDEKTYKRGKETSTLYYYYDDKGRITDIVRYNTKLGRLIPDVLFEFDESDRVIQRITTTSDRTVGYLIWRYLYDAKGLKTKEALFDNFKQLTGKIEYNYTFGS